MLLFSIILLIVVGMVLLLLEIFVLPGLIAGIIGVIFMIAGNILMYKSFGNMAGHIAFGSTILATSALFYLALKGNAWNYFSLKESNKSKVIDLNSSEVKEGDQGIALSAMRPMGTVMINNKKFEAQTNGEFVNSHSPIIVIKVYSNKLLVREK